MDKKEVANFFRHASEFLVEQVGRENVISAVVHMDEKTPHMHFTFVPLTGDNRKGIIIFICGIWIRM